MRRALLGVVCIAATAACAPRQPGRPALTVAGPIPSAQEVLSALDAKRQSVRSLRALARFRYVSATEKRRAKQVLLVSRPDRLRCEVLSPFGPVFVFTARDGVFAAYARGEHTVYRGVASPDNLERYISLQLPVAAAVDLMLGTPALPPGAGGSVSREDGYWKLWQNAAQGTYVTWFAAGLEPVRHERRDGEGRVLLRATFTNFAELDGHRLPVEVTIELPASQQRLEMALTDVEVNPVLGEALFGLETPSGSREVNLDRTVH